MNHGVHFISGLPRAGSTLLAALLRQNPRLHTGMTSPVGTLFLALQGAMSAREEGSVFITDAQRHALLTGLFTGYYADAHPTRLVFDTNRLWCSKLPALTQLFPRARVICCVRSLAWVVDSVERQIRRHPLQLSGIFGFEPSGTVYSRVEGVAQGVGMVGFAFNALREAWFGEHAARLIVIDYDSLVRDPARALALLYDQLDEPPFAHRFDAVTFDDATDFDRRAGMPDLHRVAPRVAAAPRETILPPDLFRRFEQDDFWRDPALNPRRVTVI